ncbi:MAG: hypothetical protein JJ992_08935 [Planctomycetes bacterium]|nr:hypothetical protein [Planctomycetota bacterium]
MKSTASIRVWPLLCIVAILFVLSVRAPRNWRRVAVAPIHPTTATYSGERREIKWADLGLEETPLPMIAGEQEGLGTPHVAGGEKTISPRPLTVKRTILDPASASPAVAHPSTTHDRPFRVPETPRHSLAEPYRVDNDMFGGFLVDPHLAEIDPLVANPYRNTDTLQSVAPPSEDMGSDDSSPPPTPAIRIADRNQTPGPPTESRDLVRARLTDSSTDRIASWPRCPTLTEGLLKLKEYPPAAPWCDAVLTELDALAQFDTLSADAVGLSLKNLQQLAREGQTQVAPVQSTARRNQWGRCVHGLERRLTIWQRIHDIAAARTIPVTITVRDSMHLTSVLDSVESKLKMVKHGEPWRQYLLVDQARTLTDLEADLDTAATRHLAGQILRRMEYSRLTPSQREFLQQDSFLAYSQELKHLAADAVDYFQLMEDLEDYEIQPTAECSMRIAAAQQALRWAHDEPLVRLGQDLDGRYRNANLRLAVSRDLINRWMPASEPAQLPIDETILGIRTRGCSETVARLKVGMIPSPYAWRFYLQADGEVASETAASQGPATFYTRGMSRFLAEKQIIVQPEGVEQRSAAVVAESNTGLAGLQTGVDSVPILSDIVQAIAAHQYQLRAREAEREAKNRLAWRIGETIDQQVRQQVEQMQSRFTNHFQQPMQKLGLNPIPLEMQTTEQRVIARYRLAGYHQLAAYTPRPLAPSNSLLSLQVHESAVNNTIAQFGWSGQRVNLRDVYSQLSTLFSAPKLVIPEDLPDDVTIRFADRNPVRVAFQDGRVTLTLGLSELSQGRKRWRNFVVRVHFEPAPDDPNADLVRDQYVELIGRLAFRDQIALRGVFSRVFSREKPIALVSRILAEEPRLAGLEISQLEIDDGWLALAIAPMGTRVAMHLRESRYASDNLSVR